MSFLVSTRQTTYKEAPWWLNFYYDTRLGARCFFAALTTILYSPLFIFSRTRTRQFIYYLMAATRDQGELNERLNEVDEHGEAQEWSHRTRLKLVFYALATGTLGHTTGQLAVLLLVPHLPGRRTDVIRHLNIDIQKILLNEHPNRLIDAVRSNGIRGGLVFWWRGRTAQRKQRRAILQRCERRLSISRDYPRRDVANFDPYRNLGPLDAAPTQCVRLLSRWQARQLLTQGFGRCYAKFHMWIVRLAALGLAAWFFGGAGINSIIKDVLPSSFRSEAVVLYQQSQSLDEAREKVGRALVLRVFPQLTIRESNVELAAFTLVGRAAFVALDPCDRLFDPDDDIRQAPRSTRQAAYGEWRRQCANSPFRFSDQATLERQIAQLESAVEEMNAASSPSTTVRAPASAQGS